MPFAKKFFIFVLVAGVISATVSITRAFVNAPPAGTVGDPAAGILKVSGSNFGVNTETGIVQKFTLSGNIKADAFFGTFSSPLSSDQVMGTTAFGADQGPSADYAFPRSLAVGIADATGIPTDTLQMHGNIEALDSGTDRAEINATDGFAFGNLVLQDAGQRVGVGTTNPLTALDIDGAIKIADEGVKPACNAIRRGLIWHDFGGGGVKDDVQICLKGAGGAGDYAWRTIY
jgi:hypothetical protein